jgi:hypothetical protein
LHHHHGKSKDCANSGKTRRSDHVPVLLCMSPNSLHGLAIDLFFTR